MTFKLTAFVTTASIVFFIVFASGIQPANANYPHLPEFGVACESCHFGAGGMYPLDEDCLGCHDGSVSHEVLTHSSETTSDKYGTWNMPCLACHDGMYQYQFWTYGSDSYIASGTSDVDGITDYTLTMTGAGWTPDEFVAYQLIPNTVVDGTYSYRIVGNTADTITVDEPIFIPSVTTGNTSFAIIYGRLITPSIDTPNSGPKPVRFFDATGTNSFADGDTTYDGVCEVCHTMTNHHQNDGDAPGDFDEFGGFIGHNDGTDCMDCHAHRLGFRASCDSCHDYPPTSGSHSKHLEEGIADYYGIECTTCHYDATHESGTAEIAQGDLFWTISPQPMTYSSPVCSNGCHYGAVWGGRTLTCYDCHGVMGFGGPAPSPQDAPTVNPLPDIESLTDPLVNFEWQAALPSYGFPSYTEYLVEVSNDPAFGGYAPKYSSGWITDTSWSVTLATADTWYWRITARDAALSLVTSETQSGSFVVSSPGAPSVPVIVPEPNINAGRARNITVVWNASIDPEGDPVEYYVEVARNSYFITPSAVSGWISGTQYTFQTTGCEGLYWRVRSRDATHDSVSVWSSTDYFEDVFNCGGSCPFVYVWDGETFGFETDLNGPGMLGMRSSTGVWKPNPNDYYVLQNEPVVTNGYVEMRLVEERYEVNYTDQFRLYAVDAPADRKVYGQKPTFTSPFNGLDQHLHTTALNPAAPVSVVHVDTGVDVSDATAASDQDYLVLNDDRNVGFEYQTLELDLGDLSGAPQTKLVIDATSVFPDKPSGTAHILNFGPRTKIEVLDAQGEWVSVPSTVAELPMPPEFKRPFVLDISNIFVTDVYKVRLTFLFLTYVDSIGVDTTADVPVTMTELRLARAKLRSYGHSDQNQVMDDIFEYVYNLDDPNNEHDYYPGNYTRYGPVRNLLGAVDDKFVIYGSGDELVLKFDPPIAAPAGVARSYVIYSNGYYKTGKNGIPTTVEPLPFAAMSNFPYDEAVEHYPDSRSHRRYQRRFNTRTEP